MKAVELGQEFVWFSFVVEDGKRVVNISEVYWRLSCFRKLHFFIISNKDISQRPCEQILMISSRETLVNKLDTANKHMKTFGPMSRFCLALA